MPLIFELKEGIKRVVNGLNFLKDLCEKLCILFAVIFLPQRTQRKISKEQKDPKYELAGSQERVVNGL